MADEWRRPGQPMGASSTGMAREAGAGAALTKSPRAGRAEGSVEGGNDTATPARLTEGETP